MQSIAPTAAQGLPNPPAHPWGLQGRDIPGSPHGVGDIGKPCLDQHGEQLTTQWEGSSPREEQPAGNSGMQEAQGREPGNTGLAGPSFTHPALAPVRRELVRPVSHCTPSTLHGRDRNRVLWGSPSPRNCAPHNAPRQPQPLLCC